MKTSSLLSILACVLIFPASSNGAAAGSIDASFAPALVTDGSLQVIRNTPDGRVVVAGTFQNYAGSGWKSVVRLSADGYVETEFNPGAGAIFSGVTPGSFSDVEVQPDGKVIAVGSFTLFNGVARANFVRLNTDGSVDSGFNPTVVIYDELAQAN